MISLQEKKNIIENNKINEKDTGSVNVQVALLTENIKKLTEHFKNNPKDFHSRRGMIKMICKRKSLLGYIKRKNVNEYRNLISKLGLKR